MAYFYSCRYFFCPEKLIIVIEYGIFGKGSEEAVFSRF